VIEMPVVEERKPTNEEAKRRKVDLLTIQEKISVKIKELGKSIEQKANTPCRHCKNNEPKPEPRRN
jgi:hypothetical protein